MPFEERKIREKEERRNEIIDAAEKHFFSKSYDEVRMEDIAKDVKVNKALLYYYFKNKEVLYLAIALRAAKIFDALIRERVMPEMTGLQKLHEIGLTLIDFALKYPGYYDVYFYSGSPRFRMCDEGHGSEVKALGWRTLQISLDAAREGIADGSIRRDLSPAQVAYFLSRASEGVLKTRDHGLEYLESQGISREQFLKESIEMMDHAIKAGRT
jgi:TetR/AcrR family transcriptional regulator